MVNKDTHTHTHTYHGICDGSSQGIIRVISCICDCLSVHSLKEKWLELSTQKCMGFDWYEVNSKWDIELHFNDPFAIILVLHTVRYVLDFHRSNLRNS